MEIKIMTNLAKRENLAPKSLVPTTLVWLVKVLSQLDNDDADAAATQLIEKILDKANNDNEFDKQIGKYKTYLHSLSATIQAKRGNYEKAYEAVSQLATDNPKVLAPQMSQAQILTQWAAKDPAKYEDAVNAWKVLCLKLERAKTKSGEKMPEYYDAVYQRSLCYLKMAEKNKDKQIAREGFDFLKPVLTFDPKLQGAGEDRSDLQILSTCRQADGLPR